MSCAEARRFRLARVRGQRRLQGPSLLTLDWTGDEPLPGQFFMLKPERSSVFLGRAISVFAARRGAASFELDFLIAPRSLGSTELAGLREGESVLASGPLGNAWPRPEGHIALLGGGVGIAPLRFLASTLPGGSYDVYAGYASASFGLEGLEPRRLLISSEDGSEGEKGRILDHFDARPYAAVFACGPEGMLRALSGRIGETPCFLSLERRMACGVGACLGCTVETKAGRRRCCVEGPIFEAKELVSV